MTTIDPEGHVWLDVTRPDGRHELVESTIPGYPVTEAEWAALPVLNLDGFE